MSSRQDVIYDGATAALTVLMDLCALAVPGFDDMDDEAKADTYLAWIKSVANPDDYPALSRMMAVVGITEMVREVEVERQRQAAAQAGAA